MKKIINIALCISMMAGAVSVSAQAGGNRQRSGNSEQAAPRQTREEMIKQRVERLKEQLTLDEAQFKQVFALEQERAEKAGDRLREDWSQMTDEQRTALREKMREVQEAYNAELKKILTAEQFAKYQESRQNEPRERRPNAEGQQRGGGRPAPGTRR